jgi:hypothetical protein
VFRRFARRRSTVRRRRLAAGAGVFCMVMLTLVVGMSSARTVRNAPVVTHSRCQHRSAAKARRKACASWQPLKRLKERVQAEKETTEPAPKPSQQEATTIKPSHFRFFAPTSVWNQTLTASAPLDPASAAIVGKLAEEVTQEQGEGKGPYINTTSWSVPVYTVLASQPTVRVTLEQASRAPSLQTAWNAVPLPPYAQPAAGGDKHLVVWQPSTNRLWEFWHLQNTVGGWQASWGGAIQNVSSSPGFYNAEAFPGATIWWGASASSLPLAGGLVTLEDLAAGEINHALALAVPNTRANVYALPAQRTDGGMWALSSIPEGAHLRLDPSLDLAALHLPRFTLLLAEAAQRYGIVVRDSSSEVTFYGQDPTPTGTNPYTGPYGYFEGKTPQQLLAAFPWSHLELLKMELQTQS